MTIEAPPAPPGFVKPAHLWIPERRGSYGDEAIDLAIVAGRELDGEQRQAVDAILSFGPGGRWAALEQAILEARQNGKTFAVLETVVMFDLWMLPPDKIVWTAHQFRTAREAFEDFDRAIAATPELSRRVKEIGYSHGEESIELHSGAKLEFLARSQGGGRGLGGKRTVFDEALILAAGRMGALMPILSARDDPQLTYGSSAGLLASDHLRNLRRRGRKGGDPSLVWIEYCAAGSWEDPPCADGKKCSHLYGVDGCALDDEARWKAANHTLGRRPIDGGTSKHGITLGYVRAERRTLPPSEFGRERLGWWEDPPDEGEDKPEVDMARWADLADPKAPAPTGDVAMALAVPQDRSSTAVAAAWWVDQRVMVMVTEVPGTTRTPEFVKALTVAHDVIDLSLHAGGPAGMLVAPLEHAGVEIRAVTGAEAAQATSAFIALVMPDDPDDGETGLEHLERPALTSWLELARESRTGAGEKLLGHLDQAELNAALSVARLRKAGEGKVWDQKDELSNIAPLFAATLAVNGLLKNSAPPAPFFGAWR